jgi:hypothetical protein
MGAGPKASTYIYIYIYIYIYMCIYIYILRGEHNMQEKEIGMFLTFDKNLTESFSSPWE